MNTQAEDIKSFSLPVELLGRLRNSSIIVTGATGLIGSMFVKCICTLGIGVKFILPVRNVEKAKEIFDTQKEAVTIVRADLCSYFKTLQTECDYIIHCASPTDGKYISSHPADTFLLAIESTKDILDYSRRAHVKGVVYVSSIEYYGQIYDSRPVTEDVTGYLDHASPRSSYGLGKQAAEFLCYSYAAEYGVSVKTARLTQTFGAGISVTDNRVFAQFARSVINNQDIVLHTEGLSAKPYCYTTDVVSALVYILLKGESGEAYNVATPGTYVTIRQLAEMFRQEINPGVEVVVQPMQDAGYAPVTTVNLDSRKLQSLGWTPCHDLHDMIKRTVKHISNI